MTRTTIDLDPSVLRELRRRSPIEGRSVGQVASEILAGALAQPAETANGPLEWITGNLGKSSVDLEDEEAVRAILDRAR